MPSSEFDQHDVPSTPNDSNSRKMTIRSTETKVQTTKRIYFEGILAGRKLCSEIETEEEYFESDYEFEEHDFYNYSDYEEDYEEDHVFDCAPEGMGYEFFSDDEYLGDVGYW